MAVVLATGIARTNGQSEKEGNEDGEPPENLPILDLGSGLDEILNEEHLLLEGEEAADNLFLDMGEKERLPASGTDEMMAAPPVTVETQDDESFQDQTEPPPVSLEQLGEEPSLPDGETVAETRAQDDGMAKEGLETSRPSTKFSADHMPPLLLTEPGRFLLPAPARILSESSAEKERDVADARREEDDEEIGAAPASADDLAFLDEPLEEVDMSALEEGAAAEETGAEADPALSLFEDGPPALDPATGAEVAPGEEGLAESISRRLPPISGVEGLRGKRFRQPSSGGWGLYTYVNFENYRTIPLDSVYPQLRLPLSAEVLEKEIESFADSYPLDPFTARMGNPWLPPELFQLDENWDRGLPEGPPAPESRLISLATQVAPAVVALRSWDQFGELVGEGCGFFISDDGLLMTDIQLLDPRRARDIAYVSIRTGDGQNYRADGYLMADAASGFTIIKVEAENVPYLELEPIEEYPDRKDVAVLSLQEDRGLTLADASLSVDRFLSGEGWLTLTGTDSPGVPGSPVLNDYGKVIAMVSLAVPEERWLNFALPAPDVGAVYDAVRQDPLPMSRLVSAYQDIRTNSVYERAVEDIMKGRNERAAKTLLELTKRYPRSAEAWALLGLAAARMEAYDEAVSCHRRAIALDSGEAEFWFLLAMEYMEQDESLTEQRLIAAQDALQQVVDERPADKIAWLVLAQNYLKLEEYGRAAQSLQWLLRLEPGYSHGYYLLAVARSKTGDLAGAQQAITYSLSLNDQYARAWLLQALIFDKLGMYQESIASYEEVVELEPENQKAWVNLAHAYRRIGKTSQARQAYRQHVALDRKRLASGEAATTGDDSASPSVSSR